jgi:DNA repair exonuclease SbcCD ATPase subunit
MDAQFLELSSMESSFGTLEARLAKFITEASTYKAVVISALNGQVAFESLGAWDDAPIRMALEYSAGLDDKAKQFDQAVADTATTNKLKMKHTELLGRRQLHGAIATVLARRADLGKYRQLNRCKEQCETYNISRKNTEFREKYLTVAFETALKEQVKRLGLGYLPIKIDAKTERGTSYLGVGLNKAVNVRNANILSEGEFRALALACCFAEIATIPNHDGIVIDDPVSSLDHRHMKQVAHRLVDEVKTRSQVIVFTHDLPFYYELCSAVEQAQLPIARNWVWSAPRFRPDSCRKVEGVLS